MGAHQHPPFIPLGIGYLAAVLEKNQYEVDVIDCQALKLSYEEFKSEISKRQPNIVGITSTTLTYKSALQIAKTAKEECPDCITVLGGPHVTFWDENALQECPHLDIVVRKEGENTLLELVQRLEAGKSFSDVLGTTCRKDGKIVKNPDRPYIENLDELPFPAHHLFPLSHLQKYGKVIFPLSTSRGCTFWCNFCSAVRMFGQKIPHAKPPKRHRRTRIPTQKIRSSTIHLLRRRIQRRPKTSPPNMRRNPKTKTQDNVGLRNPR